jgi:hypothetical protein
VALAEAYAWCGDVGRAFDCLAKAMEANDPDLWKIKDSPFVERLRGDPRWGLFLEAAFLTKRQLETIDFPEVGLPSPGREL